MTTDAYNLTTVIIYSISAIIALSMLGVAIWQLRKLAQQVEAAVKSNSINQLNALLSLEQQIAERRLQLSRAGISVAELKASGDQEKFDAAALGLNEAKQMYLNALDRLCYCVLKTLLPDEDMRLEYRDTIKSTVATFSEDFGVATQYRNIKKVYENWADR